MSLPELDRHGDLPEGVHHASRKEVVERFGHGTPQRQLVNKHEQTNKKEDGFIFPRMALPELQAFGIWLCPHAGGTDSPCYQRGGVLTKVPIITFGHGARHLVGTGVAQEAVESTMSAAMHEIVRNAAHTGSFWGRVTVGETSIEYRAYTLPSRDIHVGTYYPTG